VQTPSFPGPPIVYVKDKTIWEYRLLTRDLAKGQAPAEQELNIFGNEGWELAGIVTDHSTMYLYFKRLKN
jgi:hypothetical protein